MSTAGAAPARAAAPVDSAPHARVSDETVQVVVDPDGTRHRRVQRTYAGLPIVGGDYVAHVPPAAPVTYTGKQPVAVRKLGDPDRVAVPAARAALLAADAAGSRSVAGKPELVVWAVDTAPTLAWRTRVATPSHGGYERTAVVVDAQSGETITTYDETMHAQGTGHGFHSGKVPLSTTRTGETFVLVDPRRGRSETRVGHDGRIRRVRDQDNRWGDGSRGDAKSLAADVHYGMAASFDFVHDVLGRDGLLGDGSGTRAVAVHGDRFENAYWDPVEQIAVFGDGNPRRGVAPLTALDVVGHELGHAVTTSSANLLYEGESGALNEATSDILAQAIEGHARNPRDPHDYYIGEKVMRDGYLRRMDQPAADGSSFSCYRPDLGGYDVHRTSGVANHFFYLLAEGTGSQTIGGLPHRAKPCVPGSVRGIGQRPALKIWYRALTVYMTTTTGFHEARDATIAAARDLHGVGSPQCHAVEKAWSAVQVGALFESCDGEPVDILANGGFESGAAGWDGDVASIHVDGRFARNGEGYAALGELDAESVLSTTVTLPRVQHLRASWHLHIRTEEEGQGYDWLTVSLLDEAGARHRLARVSNQDSSTTDPWRRFEFDVSGFRGQDVTFEFAATNDELRTTTFVLDDVAVRGRAADGGPSELVPASAMLREDQAPHSPTLGWVAVDGDVTLDPDADRETYLREASYWCKATWYGQLGVRTYRHRVFYVAKPRDAETTMEQDVAVFESRSAARAAFETISAELSAPSCAAEAQVTALDVRDEGGQAWGSWYLQLPPGRDVELSQTLSFVLRGRSVSVVVAGANEDAFAAWDPSWMLPTTDHARENLAVYDG